jgi:hypothetical protein
VAESTITDIKTRLLDILELDAGIGKATTQSLRDANSTDRALAIVNTGAAQYGYTEGNDLQKVERDFLITICAKPLNEGVELEAEAAVEPFFDSIRTLFNARPSLSTNSNNPLANVQNTYITNDNGFEAIELGGVAWASVSFVLRVELLYGLEQAL